MKKSIFITAVTLCLAFSYIHAQNDLEEWRKQSSRDFETFKAKIEREFRDFREKANAEFAEFMSRSWEEFHAFKGIPIPKSPDPVKQPTVEPDQKPSSDPLPFGKVTPLSETEPRPQPVSPILPEPPAPVKPDTPTPEPAKPGFSFSFFGTDCKVRLDNTLRFSLQDPSEKSVSQAWKTLSGNQYDALISDCLSLRDQLNLNDWGYMLLLKTMSEKFLNGESNEAVLLQIFILTQSGYKVRISRLGDHLVLLIPFQETLYEYSFANIGGVKYYVMNKNLKGQKFYIYNHEFPKEKYFSWQAGQPKLTEKLTTPKTFTSVHYPEIKIKVQTNQNLMDLYNNHPMTADWNLYVGTGLSDVVKQTLYPALKQAIANKSKTEAAGMLLSFLQTTFDYKTDEEQFGYERPFFADENFFHPYNDCEDRSILYALLVKDLLGLEVVLLYYPSHLATAVYFPENVTGDYFSIEGKKFVVCDPTYIGASIGMAMPHLKNVSADVIKLQ